jgi:hypothetical protein
VERLCPWCGADMNEVTGGFCPACGRVLSAAAVPRPETRVTAQRPSVPPYRRPVTPNRALARRPGYPPWYTPPPAPNRPDRRPLLIGALVAVLLLAVSGLYLAHAKGSGANALSLAVTPTPATAASPTLSPTPTPAVIYQDSLTTGAIGWTPRAGHCFDRSDGFHIENGYICYVPVGDQKDFLLTVTIRQISGSLVYPVGIEFRAAYPRYYELDLYASRFWAFFRCSSSTAACAKLAGFTKTTTIKGGLKVPNTLMVRAQGPQFTFYINGHQVGRVTDRTYASGLIGLGVDANMEAVATNMTITQLS